MKNMKEANRTRQLLPGQPEKAPVETTEDQGPASPEAALYGKPEGCLHCGRCIGDCASDSPPQDTAPVSPVSAACEPKLILDEPEMPGPTPPESAVPPAPTEMTDAPRACRQCRRQVPQIARFCPDCGAEAPEVMTETYRLRFHGPADRACSFDWTGEELTIGKTPDCDLVVTDDEYLSRRHVRLTRKDGKVLLEDMGSANGTFMRVRRPVVLEPGDEILVGTSLFTLEKEG